MVGKSSGRMAKRLAMIGAVFVAPVVVVVAYEAMELRKRVASHSARLAVLANSKASLTAVIQELGHPGRSVPAVNATDLLATFPPHDRSRNSGDVQAIARGATTATLFTPSDLACIVCTNAAGVVVGSVCFPN